MQIKKSQIKNCNPDCDFWYDLTYGGYIEPEKLLDNELDVKAVLDAIKIVKEFQDAFDEACDA